MGLCDAGSAIGQFAREGASALAGRPSSLLMLPSYLKAEGPLLQNKPVIVIDAGGTNLRIALACFNDENECILTDERLYPMPGTQGPLSAKAFFDEMADIVAPYAAQSSLIGFCFSFPCEITPDLDGRLLTFNKEIQVDDAAGRLVGKSLHEALRAKGFDNPWKTVILNDTVATMMGGLAEGRRHHCSSYIGLILGTGTNMCYMEQCCNIRKDRLLASQSGQICVNIESGGYDGFPQSDFDRIVDRESGMQNYHLFEKMVSGAYQGSFVLHMLKAAAADGIFSAETAAGVVSLAALSAAETDAFCREPGGNGALSSICAPVDRDTLYALLDAFYDRSAFLTALSITGVLVLADLGRTPDTPVCIVADGSAFYKPLLFRPKLNAHIKHITEETYGRHVFFVKTKYGNFEGAAAAALLNRQLP